MADTSTAVALVEAPTENDLPVVCAWCGATIKEGTRGPASHGICRDCMAFTLVQSGYGRDVETPRVYAVMGRLANALQHRKGWDIGLVCSAMDGIVQRGKTRVAMECEVAWLAYEEGLMDVVDTKADGETVPLADAAE